MSNEVAEHMTAIPVAVCLLMGPVETVVSLGVNYAVGQQRWNLVDVREYLNGRAHLFFATAFCLLYVCCAFLS